jgi:hypothetical protein
MDIQEHVRILREERNSDPILDSFYQEYLYFKQLYSVAEKSGDRDLISQYGRILDDKVKLITSYALRKNLDNPFDNSELDEESVTGGGEAYNPGLDNPAKKYKGPEMKGEKDKEPKLAAGKIKEDYAVTHFGFTPAPSIPNRPSKGGFEYKSLWEGVLAENYNSFRKNTSTRTKAQQYHEGVKIVRKELSRINTLMEYLNKLKESLNEGGELKEMSHTRKSVDKILVKIKSIYVKAKSL